MENEILQLFVERLKLKLGEATAQIAMLEVQVEAAKHVIEEQAEKLEELTPKKERKSKKDEIPASVE